MLLYKVEKKSISSKSDSSRERGRETEEEDCMADLLSVFESIEESEGDAEVGRSEEREKKKRAIISLTPSQA